MSTNEGLLFILGGPKTATTALCGLLNSHPDVFVMCEVFLNNSYAGRWGKKLMRSHPEFLPCFFRPFEADYLENYRRAHHVLRRRHATNRYFGDKFADIDSGFSEIVQDARVVFSVRYLPEWIAKDSVRGWYHLDDNFVPFAVQYTKHFVESFLLPNVFHVRMRDFLRNNATVAAELWAFLEIDPPEKAVQWWETIGNYPVDDPKLALDWWRGHASSAVAPQENDTRVMLRDHAFWDDILRIFGKYYEAIGGKRIPRNEALSDLRRLDALIGQYSLSLDEGYLKMESVSRNDHFKNKGKKSLTSRILRRLKFKNLQQR